ncbi:MAG: hypothetical protein ABI234_07260 [Ktedonobacteraceae bacterium]
MVVDTSQVSETAVTNRTKAAIVGAWSVRAIVTSTTPHPPAGAAILGLIVFTSDGIVTPISSCTTFSVGYGGCGVWQTLPDNAPSVSFSFIEHASRNGEWLGSNYVYAPEVHFSDDGSTFSVPLVQILQRDIHGTVATEFATTLHGTRITLQPPAQMVQQTL